MRGICAAPKGHMNGDFEERKRQRILARQAPLTERVQDIGMAYDRVPGGSAETNMLAFKTAQARALYRHARRMEMDRAMLRSVIAEGLDMLSGEPSPEAVEAMCAAFAAALDKTV